MQSKKINELGTNVAPSVNDLTVVGDAATGQLKKITLSQISSLFGSTGSVSSVAMTVPTGLSISGSPITTSGTLAVTFTAGYSIPTTAKQTEWDAGYTERLKWDGGSSGLNAATARTSLGLVIGTNVLAYRTFGSAANNNTGDFATAAQGANADTAYSLRLTGASLPLSISSNVISITQAGTSANGFLSSTDWNTFNGKQAALGFTPYNATNPAGYLSSVSLTTNVTGVLPIANGGTGSTTASAARTALGLSIGSDVLAYRTFGSAANNNTSDFYASSNPSGYITSSALSPYQLQINGTGFVKASGTTISYDNTSYLSLAGGTLTGALIGTSATFSSTNGVIGNFVGSGGKYGQIYSDANAAAFGASTTTSLGTDYVYINPTSHLIALITNGTERVNIASTGAATFSSSVTAGSFLARGASAGYNIYRRDTDTYVGGWYSASGSILLDLVGVGTALTIASTGAATFISSITATQGIFSNVSSITNADQSGARLIISNTGSGGQAVNLVAGNPNVDNTGFSIAYGNTNFLRFSSTGAATFSGLVTNYNVYNTQTASYTLVLADASKIVEMNVGSANTVTIPTNASVAFPIGTEITVMQLGAGNTTLVAASGVTIRSKDFSTRIGDQYTGATLIKRGTNEWYLIGNIQP
jgi:hypothetical protein